MFKPKDLIDFEKWFATTIIHWARYWNFLQNNLSQVFYLRRNYCFIQESLVIMEKAKLTWLTNTLAICKTHGAKIPGCIKNIVIEANVNHKANGWKSSSTFTWITVNHYNVFWVFLKPFTHFVSQLWKERERWRMMIMPIIVSNASIKPFFLIWSLAHIINVILLTMSFVKKSFHLKAKKF